MEPGIHQMSNTAYHKSAGISSSQLKKFARSPQHFLYSKDHPQEQTPAMLLGSVVHTLVLEPHLFDEEYIIEPVCDKRTTVGKAEYAKFVLGMGDKTPVSPTIAAEAKEMSAAVYADEWAKATIINGVSEPSIFWTDEKTGLLCKCRPDRWRRDLEIVVDVKTTVDASPAAFQRTAWSSMFHLSAAYYMEGIYQHTGVMPQAFVLLAIEKEPPYLCVPYLLDDDMIERGRDLFRSLLDDLADCKKTDVWPGYASGEGVLTLSAPRWA